jgi:molecular chaperone GrpE
MSDHEDLIPEGPVIDRPATEDTPVPRIETAVGKPQYDEVVALLKATQADFENYQKRVGKERESDRKYYVASLARDLLPVFDNLQRAIEAAKKSGDDSPLVQGVSATLNQWLQIFSRHGITPIEAQGQPFDPNLHEAVMQQPSDEYPPGTVLQVLQQGFQIHDRVLRPASVIVSTEG